MPPGPAVATWPAHSVDAAVARAPGRDVLDCAAPDPDRARTPMAIDAPPRRTGRPPAAPMRPRPRDAGRWALTTLRVTHVGGPTVLLELDG